MSGKATRSKGRRGETEAKLLLESRDWVVWDLTAGLATEDLIANDPDGKGWIIEVKNTTAITMAHRKQAMDQAKARKMPWMLMSKIAGTGSWLVQRQGLKPTVWGANNEERASHAE